MTNDDSHSPHQLLQHFFLEKIRKVSLQLHCLVQAPPENHISLFREIVLSARSTLLFILLKNDFVLMTLIH